MSEQKIEILGVEELKTTTAIRKIMVKGEELDRQVVTKVTFEADIDANDIAQVHRLMRTGAQVNISIWSPQLSMKLQEE